MRRVCENHATCTQEKLSWPLKLRPSETEDDIIFHAAALFCNLMHLFTLQFNGTVGGLMVACIFNHGTPYSFRGDLKPTGGVLNSHGDQKRKTDVRRSLLR
jgi:hypothetical protein